MVLINYIVAYKSIVRANRWQQTSIDAAAATDKLSCLDDTRRRMFLTIADRRTTYPPPPLPVITPDHFHTGGSRLSPTPCTPYIFPSRRATKSLQPNCTATILVCWNGVLQYLAPHKLQQSFLICSDYFDHWLQMANHCVWPSVMCKFQ